MTDSTEGKPEAAFSIAHRERLAEELAELLQRHVQEIGGNSGRAGIGPDELQLEKASDAEMRGYIAGVRSLCATLHDWIEHRFAGDSDCEETHRACVRRGVSYEQINAEFDGAEGELHMRRHLHGWNPFPGKFRRLNAWLIEIRTQRCALHVELPPGEQETFTARYDAWREGREESARRWLLEPRSIGLAREISSWTFKAKTPEEAEARARVERELQALNAVCRRIREDYFERQRKEFDRSFLSGRQVAA